jgi:hypothetical protein
MFQRGKTAYNVGHGHRERKRRGTIYFKGMYSGEAFQTTRQVQGEDMTVVQTTTAILGQGSSKYRCHQQSGIQANKNGCYKDGKSVLASVDHMTDLNAVRQTMSQPRFS